MTIFDEKWRYIKFIKILMNYYKMFRSVSFAFGMIFVFIAISTISNSYAHSMFNSAEETIGDYRVQVATLPEFPQIGEPSQILFRVTDKNLDEVDRFTMGIRVFFDDKQIDTIPPNSHQGGHWETNYVFENPGNHIFKVDLYDMENPGVTTYTFNMSTQSPFGYIFFISITIGATIFAIVMGYIYLPKMLKSRF